MFAGQTTGVMGHNPRWMGGTGFGCASYSTLQMDSSRYGQEFRDANEIVGDRSQDTRPKSSMWRAIKSTNTRGDSFRRPRKTGGLCQLTALTRSTIFCYALLLTPYLAWQPVGRGQQLFGRFRHVVAAPSGRR
jgi:hypothetical protein